MIERVLSILTFFMISIEIVSLIVIGIIIVTVMMHIAVKVTYKIIKFIDGDVN